MLRVHGMFLPLGVLFWKGDESGLSYLFCRRVLWGTVKQAHGISRATAP